MPVVRAVHRIISGHSSVSIWPVSDFNNRNLFRRRVEADPGKKSGQQGRSKTPLRYVPSAHVVQSMAIGAPGDPVAPTIGAGEYMYAKVYTSSRISSSKYITSWFTRPWRVSKWVWIQKTQPGSSPGSASAREEIFLAATDQNLRKLAKYGDRAPPTGSPPTGPRQKLVEPFKTQTRYRSRGVAAQMSATKTPDETEHRQSTGFPTQSNRK